MNEGSSVLGMLVFVLASAAHMLKLGLLVLMMLGFFIGNLELK